MAEDTDRTAPGVLARAGRRGWNARVPVLAGAAALASAGLLLALSGTSGEGAMSNYRPGGLDLHRAGRALASGSEQVTGCEPLAEAQNPYWAGAPVASVKRLLHIIAKSQTTRDVLNRVRGRKIHVCLDDETKLLAYYFSSMGVIGLSTGLSEGGRIAFLAHELSHVPQHPRYSDNRYFPPQDLVLLRRFREAAAEAVATRIAWELRAAGHPEAWAEKERSPYDDVARAFGEAAGRDPSAGGLRAATRAAFDRWFTARWRRDVYDAMTLDHLERISDDELGLVPPRRRLNESLLVGIARLNGGNFLAETHGRALTDPYYSGHVSDRNAARLRRVLHDAELAVTPIDETPMAGVAS